MPDDVSRAPIDDPLALAGELIGAPVTVEVAPGQGRLPLDGVIVDETMQTFRIRSAGQERARQVAKTGLVGTILLGGRSIRLRGDALRVRSEDRTKRLTLAGRRRNR
jgi:RNase P/RNase MRP subunit p29